MEQGGETTARRGIMLVLSSPSGAGKTTLTRSLLEQDDNLALSISVTTRARRASEIDGVHYRFLTQRQFDALRDSGQLLEHAEVHGHSYGTPREPVENALAAGRDVLFDIDWQGAQQLSITMHSDIVSVFVLPPSAQELKARLERRAEDSSETIARRLRNARDEIVHWQKYDYVIVNSDLDKSFAQLRAILMAARLRRARDNPSMGAFVTELIGQLEVLAP